MTYSKYIIEISNECYSCDDDEEDMVSLRRVKGFNSLVFDQRGIDKLKPYDGIRKWNLGRTEVFNILRLVSQLTKEQRIQAFGYESIEDLIANNPEADYNTVFLMLKSNYYLNSSVSKDDN